MWYSSDVKPVNGTVCVLTKMSKGNYLVLYNYHFDLFDTLTPFLWSYIQEPIITKNETE